MQLDGDNFAPLGDRQTCVWRTPGRNIGNGTVVIVEESHTLASYVSPTRVACRSPSYQVLGLTELWLNNSFNTSLYDVFPSTRQVVNFTYYDRTRAPVLTSITPTSVPIGGLNVRFVGGAGAWGEWVGTEPQGGMLLVGTNFAPTNFLWCAFGMPPEIYTTTRGSWRWTRALYLNATAVRCEVPEGYLGDYPVAASTDDVLFSTNNPTFTYYDPLSRANVAPGQRLALAETDSGFLIQDPQNPGVILYDNTKELITLSGSNFANFTADGQLLCRFGSEILRRDTSFIPENNTEPLEELENVVRATFLSATSMRYRQAGVESRSRRTDALCQKAAALIMSSSRLSTVRIPLVTAAARRIVLRAPLSAFT